MSILENLPDGAYAVHVWVRGQEARDEVIPDDLPNEDIVISSDPEDNFEGTPPPHAGQRLYWRVWFKEDHRRNQYLLKIVRQYAGCSVKVVAGPTRPGFPDLWSSVVDLSFVNYVYAEVPWPEVRERLIRIAPQRWVAPAGGRARDQHIREINRQHQFVRQDYFRTQTLFGNPPLVGDTKRNNRSWLIEGAEDAIRKLAGNGEQPPLTPPRTLYRFTPAYLRDLMLQRRHLSLTEDDHALFIRMVLMMWILSSRMDTYTVHLIPTHSRTYRRILWYVAACVANSEALGDDSCWVDPVPDWGYAYVKEEGITYEADLGFYCLYLYDDMYVPPAASFEVWMEYYNSMDEGQDEELHALWSQ